MGKLETFIAAFLLFCCFLPAQSSDLALLIGIDEYPYPYTLRGCKNDIELFRETLIRRFGFDATNISTLTDRQATRAAILEKFSHMAEKAEQGTRFVLFFSGHGSQKLDQKHGDEEDGRDETLVPYGSYQMVKKGKEDIRDDEIDAFLRKMVAKKAVVSVVFDCCHSGTGVRGTTNTRSIEREIEVEANRKFTVREAPPGVVFISACQPYERTPEYRAPGNKTFGLLTYHLVKAIEKQARSNRFATFRSVFDELQTLYASLSHPPTPALEGDEHRKIFGKELIELPNVVGVKELAGREAVLDAGSLRNVTIGSIFCLLQRAEDLTATNLAQKKHILVKIVDVDYFESWAAVLSQQERQQLKESLPQSLFADRGRLENITPSWQAVELIHDYGDLRLALALEREVVVEKNGLRTLDRQPLSLSQLPPGFQKKLTGLVQDKVIRIVQDEEADALLRLGNHTAVVVSAQGNDLATSPSIPEDPMQYEPSGFGPISLSPDENSLALLERILIQYNKVLNLLKLKPPSEEALKVSARLVEVKRERRRYKPTQKTLGDSRNALPLLEDGTLFGIEVDNKSGIKLYPTVLFIGNNLEVNVLYPPRGSTWSVPEYATRTPRRGVWAVDASHPGRETLKILVTTEPVDFYHIEMEKLPTNSDPERDKTENTVLGNFLFQAAFGSKRSGAGKIELRSPKFVANPPQWSVLTLGWKTKGAP